MPSDPGCSVALEGDERIAETIRLPVGLRFAPTAGVPCQAEYEFVMTPVLVCLIGVSLRTSIGGRLHSGRAQKRQPDGMVIRLVGAVLEFGQDGRSESCRSCR